MSVVFHAPEVSRAFSVDMGMATGRIVLRLLGRNSQYQQGSMPVGLMKAQLASITPAVIAANATEPAQRGPQQFDRGTPVA